ncbi:MAG: PHP domain-containing protein, partial [Bacillota bacterium]|nr:PHP domain-containing protein [Bacillota bacterium]
MPFVHLRVHSEYSFLRGACRLEQLVERAKELGMPAVALTDYGALHGAVRFGGLAREYGILPIVGAEFTLSCGLPLVLLVRNRTGWQNLLRLVNQFQLTVPKKQAVEPEEVGRFAGGLTALLHTRGEGVRFDEKSTP